MAEQAATVLIVEDEPLVRMNAADIVEEAGWKAIEAANSSEALKLLDANIPVDVLFRLVVQSVGPLLDPLWTAWGERPVQQLFLDEAEALALEHLLRRESLPQQLEFGKSVART